MILPRTRVKLCGMTREEDIDYAGQLGVDAIGLIFYPKSPRYVSLEKAKKLVRTLPPFVDLVAVLVNPDKKEVEALLQELPINALQFHGQEDPEFCEQFRTHYFKALQVDDKDTITKATQVYESAQALLLDTPSALGGGSGKSFNWNFIPEKNSKPLILAGGLGIDNIKEAISEVRPYAVDINSGIEISPGIKDHTKLKQLLKVLWGANESL